MKNRFLKGVIGASLITSSILAKEPFIRYEAQIRAGYIFKQ